MANPVDRFWLTGFLVFCMMFLSRKIWLKLKMIAGIIADYFRMSYNIHIKGTHANIIFMEVSHDKRAGTWFKDYGADERTWRREQKDTASFDMLFRAKNPTLSTETIMVNLRVDVEPQKDYKPGYPIEKRGIYYLSRMISSQNVRIDNYTDYKQLGLLL